MDGSEEGYGVRVGWDEEGHLYRISFESVDHRKHASECRPKLLHGLDFMVDNASGCLAVADIVF